MMEGLASHHLLRQDIPSTDPDSSILIRTGLLKFRTTPLSYIRTLMMRTELKPYLLFLECLRYLMAGRTVHTPYKHCLSHRL